MSSNLLMYLAPLGATLALVYSLVLIAVVMKSPRGCEEVRSIQDAIATGANAYIRRQYAVVACFFGIGFIVLLWLAAKNYLAAPVPYAFLTGGFFSAFAGYIGLRMATAANARTTTATEKGLDAGLRIAFSSGSVMGFVVVGLGLLDLSAWYFTLNHMYADMPELERVSHIASTMLSFGMGASLQALFARVGGGIYTKAADVGADLVGKVEAGIPEDDVRNPATIADNVGDNVGDVAGMGADLYESYVGSIVASMALAAAAGLGLAGTLLPLGIAAVGVASSLFGTIFVKAREGATQLQLLGALRKGIVASAVTVAVLSWFLVHTVMPLPFRGVYWAILTGLLAGVLIGFATEYFTSDCYKPARSIAKSAETGAATVIISGLGIGMFSTALPVIIIVTAITVAFYASGGSEHFMLGLYGIGIAAVGMLSTLGMTLATDSYGPVADNAGGIAQMSKRQQTVRDRTDALDALGNTTAATGKGFAIGSAALTGLTLITAYRIDVVSLGHQLNLSVDNPKLIAGLFLGGMLPFLFCALCINAVGNAASSIVTEVRRQFKQIVGLLEGKAKAEYGECVRLCTVAAQKQMILPALTAVLVPIAVGLIFNVEGVVGLLVGSLVSGFVLAIFMANAGGAWDNAKKYVETGELGGKGSDAHKATVVGDTVGDPLKDTAGPSVNILIKLMSMVSVVFASFILRHAIF